ncbi:nucleotidyltransferase family protein [Pseudomonas saxonica]|uniref:Nucleotidyltransferase family protein n=1 Tax=Pseudomonas saxonica TaxID=2600598 RepID=A0A5C5Q2W6_9PSED|nr:nucleotidyltransferase family protein [Pseudomonas saxonica]TWR94319.1 nucleotidyltransferase family protein [Pseudomonas saxonica]
MRLWEDGTYEIAAPLVFHDLFDLIIRPAGRFVIDKNAIYQDRGTSKNWLKVWPMLTLSGLPPSPCVKVT